MRLSHWLYRVSKGWVVLLGIVIFFAFTALVLPSQAESAARYSGDAGSPDSSFFYTPDDLYEFAEAYGEAGRADYIRARFTFDLAWPIVYTLFLATSLSWVFQRILGPDNRWRFLNLLPILGMIFDYLENLAASLVIWRFPETTPVFEWLAPLFTLMKWFLIMASFFLLFLGIIFWAVQWVRTRFSVDN